jgi:hypothetical protein
MLGTPEIVAVIIGLFSDLDDLRVVSHAVDKVMDIQAAKAAAPATVGSARRTRTPLCDDIRRPEAEFPSAR